PALASLPTSSGTKATRRSPATVSLQTPTIMRPRWVQVIATSRLSGPAVDVLFQNMNGQLVIVRLIRIQIANGNHAQQPALAVHDGKVAHAAVLPRGPRFLDGSLPRVPRRHGGHDIADPGRG